MCVQRGELADLQKKSPEDLWKEDLAIFIEELDVSFSVGMQTKVHSKGFLCGVTCRLGCTKPLLSLYLQCASRCSVFVE